MQNVVQLQSTVNTKKKIKMQALKATEQTPTVKCLMGF